MSNAVDTLIDQLFKARNNILDVRQDILNLKLDVVQWGAVIILACGNHWLIQASGWLVLVSILVSRWWVDRQASDAPVDEDQQ